MTLVGPANQNMSQTLEGLVGCCSGKGYWMTCGGRSGAGAYTEYGVGTVPRRLFSLRQKHPITMNWGSV